MTKRKKYKPGQIIPASGIYRVEHDSHRLMHEATLLAENLFPRCRQCDSAVRFHLVRAIHGRRVLPFGSSTILEEFERPTRPFVVAS